MLAFFLYFSVVFLFFSIFVSLGFPKENAFVFLFSFLTRKPTLAHITFIILSTTWQGGSHPLPLSDIWVFRTHSFSWGLPGSSPALVRRSECQQATEVGRPWKALLWLP